LNLSGFAHSVQLRLAAVLARREFRQDTLSAKKVEA